MLDHTGLNVSDFAKSRAFYEKALAPLGYTLLVEFASEVTGSTRYAGFGVPPKPDFWIGEGEANRPPIHVAFRADSRATVDAFYAGAIASGGATTARPDCGRTITRTTTGRLCWIPTATTSKRCVTPPPEFNLSRATR
jgi:catechol 2,3-dioxygenase-like lactoylglutathione lyase family enzyme